MTGQDRILYFPSRGKAEPIRMMYGIAGRELTDDRVSPEDWRVNKPEIKKGNFKEIAYLI